MTVFVFISQKPLRVKSYSPLTALYEDNAGILGVSKSKLDKWDFNTFDYTGSIIIISKTKTLSAGDVRRALAQKDHHLLK